MTAKHWVVIEDRVLEREDSYMQLADVEGYGVDDDEEDNDDDDGL